MKGKVVLDEIDVKEIIRDYIKKEWGLQDEQIAVYLICEECRKRDEEFEIIAEVRRHW